MVSKLMHMDLKPQNSNSDLTGSLTTDFNCKLNSSITKCVCVWIVKVRANPNPLLLSVRMMTYPMALTDDHSDVMKAFFIGYRVRSTEIYSILLYGKVSVSNCSHYSLRLVSLSNDS